MKNIPPSSSAISLTNKTRFRAVPLKKIKRFLQTILDILGHKNAGLEVLLITDRTMMQWNKRVFGRTGSTDVISFPFNERYFLGSILIAADKKEAKARQYRHSFQKELKLLLIHGVLHLMGFDHDCSRRATRMRKMEQKLFCKTKYLR